MVSCPGRRKKYEQRGPENVGSFGTAIMVVSADRGLRLPSFAESALFDHQDFSLRVTLSVLMILHHCNNLASMLDETERY